LVVWFLVRSRSGVHSRFCVKKEKQKANENDNDAEKDSSSSNQVVRYTGGTEIVHSSSSVYLPVSIWGSRLKQLEEELAKLRFEKLHTMRDKDLDQKTKAEIIAYLEGEIQEIKTKIANGEVKLDEVRRRTREREHQELDEKIKLVETVRGGNPSQKSVGELTVDIIQRSSNRQDGGGSPCSGINCDISGNEGLFGFDQAGLGDRLSFGGVPLGVSDHLLHEVTPEPKPLQMWTNFFFNFISVEKPKND